MFELRGKSARKGKVKRLKPKTVRKIIATLSAILTEAVDDGVIVGNPTVQLKKVYRPTRSRTGQLPAPSTR